MFAIVQQNQLTLTAHFSIMPETQDMTGTGIEHRNGRKGGSLAGVIPVAHDIHEGIRCCLGLSDEVIGSLLQLLKSCQCSEDLLLPLGGQGGDINVPEVPSWDGRADIGCLVECSVDAGRQVVGVELGIGDFQDCHPDGSDPLLTVVGEDTSGHGGMRRDEHISVLQPT